MPNKKTGKENIRKITKTGSGSTYYVTIPKAYIKKFGWKQGQRVIVRKYKGKNCLVIEDFKPNA